MKHILYLSISLFLSVFTSPVQAQMWFEGRVMSRTDSLPLSYATVSIAGKNQAISDARGMFRIRLSVSDTVINVTVTRIGYRPFEAQWAKGSGVHPIYLSPDPTTIQEVPVFTGYQQLPRERATGSFGVVDSALFHRQISTDLLSRLDGLAASLLFDKRTGNMDLSRLSIRGRSTLTTEIMHPLVIVDNFPYEGNLENINPNDVENITLLKDAAAASIWGARAGNGVLVITTRRAGYRNPLDITGTANISIQEREDLYYPPQIASSDFIDVERFLFDRGFYNGNLNNTTTYPVVTPVVELLDRLRKGELTETEAESQIDALRRFDVRDDLHAHFHRPAVRQQYGLALRSGGVRSHVYASGGYDRNLDNKIGNAFSRATVRVANTMKLFEGFEVSLGVNYALTERENNHPSSINIASTTPIYPYARLADEQGYPLVLEKNRRAGYIDTAGNGQLLDWRYRPLEELGLSDNSTQLQSAVMDIGVSYKLFPWAGINVKYQHQRQHSVATNLQSEALWSTRDAINQFTVIRNGVPEYGIPRGASLAKGFADLVGHNLRGQVDINKAWGMHTIDLLGGSELRANIRHAESYRTWGYDPGTLTSQPVNLRDRLPLYSGGTAAIQDATSFRGMHDRFISVYANGAYSFMGRYTLSVSMRKDASNLFGVSTNNRWKPLWSAGAAWTISEEEWFDPGLFEPGLFGLLKARVTYGHSGNVNNTLPAITTIQYASSVNRFSGYPYASVANAPNPLLRWEDVATWNAGLDFSLASNRISGTLEYYNKYNADLVSSIPSDPTTGFQSLWLNVADMRTRGMDLTLSGDLLRGPLEWKVSGFLSYNTNKILTYYRDMPLFGLPGTNGPLVMGYGYGTLFSHRWAGLDPETGDPMGYLGGEVSKDYRRMTTALGVEELTMDDIVVHGPGLPTYFGGLMHHLSWRQISFSTNITYRTGYYFFRDVLNYSSLLSGINSHADYYRRWQQPGDEQFTDVPSLVYPADAARQHFYQEAEVNVERGDHVRIQDMVLNYRLNPDIARRWGMAQLHFSLQAQNMNVFLWRANQKGIDPDYRGIPIPPTYSMGLNVKF